MGKTHVKIGQNPRKAWAPILIGMVFAALPSLLPAQVSLATVVDLAQRNSSAVRLAEADEQKTKALLAETEDVYAPNLVVGSTVGTSVGFPTGQPSIANASMQSLVLSYSQRQYIKAAHAGLQAASLNLKEAREQVALDASTAYIELDTVDRELEAAQQQEIFAGRLVEIERERSEAGVDPLSDLLSARLTAAQIKLRRLHLQTRAATLAKQISTLTGLPDGSIKPDRASIPEIPAVTADDPARPTAGIESARMLAQSKQFQAHGDELTRHRPQVSFGAQYNLDSDKLNNYSQYYKNFTPNNFALGQIPLFDLGGRAKSRESAAESLRSRVEVEQAQRQNDVQIAQLTGSLRELDTVAEIATLKQQIADEQIKTVEAQLELGNGSESGPGAQPQLTPKAEQLARIDERQKFQDALDAGLELSKARLNLLRALGHMQDWLRELNAK
jgi:outer membrane protein TolC